MNAAKQTDDYVTAMQQAVDGVKSWVGKGAPSGSGAAFRAFYTNWKNFYANNFSSRFTQLVHEATSDLQSSLVNYQNQAADWGKKLKKWKVEVAATPTPSAPGGASNVLMYVGIGAVALVGLFIIGKLVHTVALGGAALEEAENEAMRLADEKKRKRQDRTAFSIT